MKASHPISPVWRVAPERLTTSLSEVTAAALQAPVHEMVRRMPLWIRSVRRLEYIPWSALKYTGNFLSLSSSGAGNSGR